MTNSSVNRFGSSIMDQYDLVQTEPGGPTLLIKSKTNEPRPPFYGSQWAGPLGDALPMTGMTVSLCPPPTYQDPTFDFMRKLVMAWSDPLSEMVAMWVQRDSANPLPITERAYYLTLALMADTFANVPSMPPPEVTLSGDGGIDLEWESDIMSITIHVRCDSKQPDRIYCEVAGEHKSLDLTKDNYYECLGRLSLSYG